MNLLAQSDLENAPQKAWVIFNGQTDVPWLRILRPGYRHCYIILSEGGQWLSIDPMLHHMDVQMHKHLPPDFDLPGWLAARGQTVVLAFIDRSRVKPAPWRPFTCVEAVKRILGLHARHVITPWQLYRYLIQPDQQKEICHGKSDFTPQGFTRSAT